MQVEAKPILTNRDGQQPHNVKNKTFYTYKSYNCNPF
jgi:hypothetical protein